MVWKGWDDGLSTSGDADEAHAPAVEADGDFTSGRLQLLDLVIDHEQFPNG